MILPFKIYLPPIFTPKAKVFCWSPPSLAFFVRDSTYAPSFFFFAPLCTSQNLHSMCRHVLGHVYAPIRKNISLYCKAPWSQDPIIIILSASFFTDQPHIGLAILNSFAFGFLIITQPSMSNWSSNHEWFRTGVSLSSSIDWLPERWCDRIYIAQVSMRSALAFRDWIESTVFFFKWFFESFRSTTAKTTPQAV